MAPWSPVERDDEAGELVAVPGQPPAGSGRRPRRVEVKEAPLLVGARLVTGGARRRPPGPPRYDGLVVDAGRNAAATMPAGQTGPAPAVAEVDRHLEVLPDRREAAPRPARRVGPRSGSSHQTTRLRDGAVGRPRRQLGGPGLDRVQHRLAEPASAMLRVHVVVGGDLAGRLRPHPAHGGDQVRPGRRPPTSLSPGGTRVASTRRPRRSSCRARLTCVGALGGVEDGLDAAASSGSRVAQDVARRAVARRPLRVVGQPAQSSPGAPDDARAGAARAAPALSLSRIRPLADGRSASRAYIPSSSRWMCATLWTVSGRRGTQPEQDDDAEDQPPGHHVRRVLVRRASAPR